jgi:ATP-binding cassette subfamily B protein
LVLIAVFLTTLLGLVPPLLIGRIFDDAINQKNATLLLIYVVMMVGATMLSGIIEVGQNYLNNKVGQSVMSDFRNQLYQHLQSQPLRFFTETRTGEILSRLSNDVSGVQDVVTNTAISLLSNISVVVSTVIVMVILSPFLTLMTFGLLPLFVWINHKIGNIRRQTRKETQKSLASLTALMQETLSVSGILLVKVFGQQKYVQAQFKQEDQKLKHLMIRQLMIGSWLSMLITTFFGLVPALFFLVAGSQIIYNIPILGGSMTLGTIAAFTTLQFRLFFPMGGLLSLQVELQGALALFDRIFEYLDLPIEIQDKPDALHLTPGKVRGEVTFRNVTFSYKRDVYNTLTDFNEIGMPDNSEVMSPTPSQPDASPSVEIVPRACPPEDPCPVLKNISFTIKPGQLVALVGPSGAGKTTITYLLPRLYDVDSGAVEIDGINVKDIALASLGELIGIVTQETYLFHASIRENLLYARQDATENEMMAAARAAAIHDHIMELEDGYNTIVGERGYKLSGGEKQRIAIARVVLKNPRILLLDEATSALDTHSERLIQTALETVMKGRTTLAIAHRLSTIQAADMILVVNEGKIVEYGTHQNLLALGRLYAQLYHEQFSQPLETKPVGTGQTQVPVRRNWALTLPGTRPTQQTVPTFEAQTPYPKLLKYMQYATIPSKRQFRLPIGGNKPV